MSGLNVTRKIYVDDVTADVSFCRFTEILENPTGSDITVSVLIEGNLGSDESNDDVNSSSDGDTTVDPGDIWVTNHQDSSDPALGFFFPGADSPFKSGDDLEYGYSSVTVPAGGRVTIIHWAFQNTGTSPPAVTAIEDLLVSFGSTGAGIANTYFNGLTISEVADSFFPFTGDGVFGGAGAVAPFADVTVTNATTAESITSPAASDGSFKIFFALGATTGDSITVTATDGTSQVLTFP